MELALFDFDGTITTKDSFIGFIAFAVGKPVFYLGMAIQGPMLMAYALRLIPNYIAKEKLITHFFGGWEISRFQKIADEYSTYQVDKIVRPGAMEKIAWHQSQGHKVVVVSASMDNWLNKWCEKNSLELISSHLEVKAGNLTGRLAGKNCQNMEKVIRIKQEYDLAQYSTIYAYGNSSGDYEMLNIATEKFYREFE